MTRHRIIRLAAAGVAAVTFTAACGESNNDSAGTPVIKVGNASSYRPAVDPANFVDVIDNPYWSLTPGSKWVYEGTDSEETERIEVTVLSERRLVTGIQAVVVRDTVTVDGELKEDTWDWYAQDRDGNVWYLGEETKEYEDGEVVSTHGSWEAGVDGALPGIVMKAHPKVGDAYRQEYFKGEAEDLAEVVRVDAVETVQAGRYDKLVVIREWNPLEPKVVEEKFYAPGVGVVLEKKVTGGTGRVELVEYTPGQPGFSPAGA
jgi:hypothetical protein